MKDLSFLLRCYIQETYKHEKANYTKIQNYAIEENSVIVVYEFYNYRTQTIDTQKIVVSLWELLAFTFSTIYKLS